MKKNQIRVTVVGDGDTGKTCMLIVYKDRKFDERYIPTIFDVYSMTIPINGKEYTVILQDTAGQEEFDKLRQLAYKEVSIIRYAHPAKNAFSRQTFLFCATLSMIKIRGITSKRNGHLN